MATGRIYFKGTDTDIDSLEYLLDNIGFINDYDDYLDDNSEENKVLKIFLEYAKDTFDGYDGFSDLQSKTYDFRRAENLVDIGCYDRCYPAQGDFPTDDFAYVLGKTFPDMSFFVVGDLVNTGACSGINYCVYNKGELVNYELLWFYQDGKEYEFAQDNSIESLVLDLVRAEINIWELDDADNEEKRAAKLEAEALRQELEAIWEKWNKLYADENNHK